jgi:Tol biopolymer transport system component
VQLALSPDGTSLAFTTLQQNADLWRLPVSPETGVATGEPGSLTATTREDSRGSWSPDGARIAFNSDRGGEMNLWLHDIGTDVTTQLTRGAGGDYQPFWSPDGERIVFFSLRSGSSDIWEVDAAGGEPLRLTEGEGIEVNPCYSPDGTRIAYQSDRDGRLEVWVMGADGGDPRQLTRVGVRGHFLRWTDDGRYVVFRRPMAEGSETWLAPADGGPPVKMPGEIRGGSHMSFSPDRSRILDVSGHRTLWVSPVEGGEIVKSFEFADPRARIDYPSWSPDGRWVLFDRFVPEGGDIWEISLPDGD